MLDYLRAQKVLTCSMVEELQSKTTTTGMHGAMLDMLSRRPAAAYFNYIQALTNAGRNDIADILRRANGQQEQVLQWEQQKLLQQELPQHVVHMPFQVGATHGFDDINRNFSRMELTKQSSARSIHGHYLTTVEIYSETLPYTSVPFQILPYVAAILLEYPINVVKNWAEAPGLQDLERYTSIYTQEITTVINLMHTLKGAGFEIMSTRELSNTDQKVYSCLNNLAQIWTATDLRVYNPKWDLTVVSPVDLKKTAILLHLIMAVEPQHLCFVLKKVWSDTRPAAYLCYNAHTPVESSHLIPDTIRQTVKEEINKDESDKDPALKD